MQTTNITPVRIITATRPSKKEAKPFEVRYIQSLNLITVKGYSVTKDIHKKYAQLLIDIDQHLEEHDSLNLHFKYEFFNSSSLRYLFVIFNTLNGAHLQGKKVSVYWSCTPSNKNEIVDTGLDLAEMCEFNFQISHL